MLKSQVMSSSEGQTLSSRDPTSWDRARSPGPWLWAPSTSTHTGNTGSPNLQSGLSLGSVWRAEGSVSGKEAQKTPEEGKTLATPLATRGNSHSPSLLPPACAHPCSSSPRCWERSSGSTEYMSFASNFRLWPILNKGFSHLLKIKRKVTYIQITHLCLIIILHSWILF